MQHVQLAVGPVQELFALTLLVAMHVQMKEQGLYIDFAGCHAGSDEGAFAWLTLNYLLGFLGKEGADTMAAIDLGGGSVQEAFALTDAQAKAAPDPLYITKLKGGGVTYSVYVHRYCVWGASLTLLSQDQFQSYSSVY